MQRYTNSQIICIPAELSPQNAHARCTYRVCAASFLLKNVCYIKHYLLFLRTISYKHGQEYIWENHAKGINAAIAAYG